MRVPTAIWPIALLSVTSIAFSLRAQAPAGPARGWPPLPQNIVNLSGTTGLIEAGGKAEVYSVPSDRWLVLTDLRWADEGNNITSAILSEETPTGLIDKTGLAYPFSSSLVGSGAHFGSVASSPPLEHSGVGLTFRPGSKVIVRSQDGSALGSVSFMMCGYLAAQ